MSKPPLPRLEGSERRVVGSLAAIYASRMLGLFLLLPVLALYAGGLPGATPFLVGISVGAYGLAQGCLQIPFGSWSDRYGRKRVIAGGLVLYMAGSVLGAFAGTVWGVIAARLLQGSGAVSGPVTALLADLTRTEVRTRAMALIGVSIGLSFIVSLVSAPPLQAAIGVSGLFWIMAALAVVALLLLWLAVPTPVVSTHLAAPQDRRWSRVLTRELMPFYVGVFVLHFVLVGTFVGVPHVLRDVLGIAPAEHWKTYLGVFMASLAGTVPLILRAERSAQPDRILHAGIAVMAVAELLLVFDHRHFNAVVVPLTLFFATFNFLEARLPARLSQAAPHDARGLALGVFATFQFIGAFVGGAVSGALLGSPLGLSGVFLGSALVVAAWWVIQRSTGSRKVAT